MPLLSRSSRGILKQYEEVFDARMMLLTLHVCGVNPLQPEGVAVIAMCMLQATATVVFRRPNLVPKNPMDYMDDVAFEYNFRFSKEDVLNSVRLLSIPNVVRLRGWTERAPHTCSGVIMLLVSLNRMQYPSKYVALELLFGLKYQKLSRIFNTGIDLLYAFFSTRLHFERIVIVGRRFLYVQAIWDKSGRLIGNCVGFLDATLHKCCRPTWFQDVMFNGHKRLQFMVLWKVGATTQQYCDFQG